MKTKHISQSILVISLTIHLFSVYSKLLYYLNPEVLSKESFSFIIFNEQTILAMVFALSYSLATFSIVFNAGKRGLIILFGSLDTIGVLLYYFTDIPLYYGAIYFAIYTGALIISTLYLRNPDRLPEQILRMKENGDTQKIIADKLGISESKVSRVVKGIKE